ncbi:bifunctional heptose 7-phosphate kinase/heptose 1-phosphate adenyltransferase [Aquirufa nivalisilvae]|jgi:rfaE bifunctional protein kinase chain/domain|uniref:bifunctional heptose 7-phosphate kinase/heptose 1-phosphate adenyltransferase n=1 Tax=Aquirufa nivalisilvae TaxID=2516557 RepID=UPI0022A968E5|nr:bifunctional ADP-heptose synthase [Aquirufa nivalisilvae]MCZ2480692.1 D-glycero-beta-D-manno-heptose-7-phosphate kinase [Aquirufa nivalisilvae]
MKTVNDIFKGFDQLQVLVIGDLMIDAYTWGKVSRISPEAPVPVVQVIKKEARLGGAGNVVMNIASLGAKPWVVSVVGDDEAGLQLKSLLEKEGISLSGIVEEKGRITSIKERIIAGSQQLLRVDSETDKLVQHASSAALLEKVKACIKEVDVIIFEDYDKGVLNEQLIQEVITLARKHGIPTVVDPKKRNFFSYRGATLFKPNLHELRDGLGLFPEDLEGQKLLETVHQFKESQGFDGVFVTLSEKGVLMDLGKEQVRIPAHIRQIADVSGAGDTVISIAACALALGLPARHIASLANLGGGLVCESLGVVPIDKELLKKEAESHLM